jgi:hypothetical protein
MLMKTKIQQWYTATSRSSKMTVLEWGLLGGAVLISFVVHWFFLIDGFGEPDACEFGNMAVQWHKTGDFRYLYYVRTSVFYLQVLKASLDCGMPAWQLPHFMNGMNAGFGSLLLVPYYLLWKKLSNTTTAFLSILLLSFAPAFWIGCIYGMPHIPALFFFGFSLVFFLGYLESEEKRRYVFWGLSIVFAILTLGFKADILLCFGAFGGLVFLRKRILCREMIFAAAAILLAFLFFIFYPKMLFGNIESFSRFSNQWNQDFPFNPKAWLDIKNIGSTVTASGIVFSSLSVLAWGYAIVRRQHLRHMAFALSWCLPIVLFWTLKMGNSSRHMVSSILVILFFTAFIVSGFFRRDWTMWGVVLGIIILNYFLCPDRLLPRTYRPSSRLFAAQPRIQAIVDRWHELGRRFYASPADKKVIAGECYTRYVEWETLRQIEDWKFGENLGVYHYVQGGREKQFCNIYIETEDELKQILNTYKGWEVWEWVSEADNTRFEIRRISESIPGCFEAKD